MASPLRGIPLAPLTGVLDLRSSPDSIPAGGLRYRLNFQTIGENKLRRGCGWSKHLSQDDYVNADFHDQLLIFSGGIRQPVTMLYNAVSTQRVRSLLAATQSQIVQFNEHAGNWRVLGSGFGGEAQTSAAAPRFKRAQQGDYVIFTNDFDPPMYHILGQGSEGGLLQEFDDLATIGLTRAAVVWVWNNCVFFADIELDGRRRPHMFIWSDFDNPTALNPGTAGTIAGSQELYTHERILAGHPFGNSFLIYTTHGIWEMSVVGGDRSFAVRRAYNAEDNEGKAVLKYPNTLIGLVDAHMYAGEDGLYLFNQFYNQPERVEWLHRATPWLYDNIDTVNCSVHVAVVHGDEALFSVAKNDDLNQCPSVTLRINTQYQVADLIDAGFTAFANSRSYDVPTIRDFIIENEICTLAELIAAGYGYGDEGLPDPLPSGTAAFTPQSIYTLTPKTEIWGPIGPLQVTVSRERMSNVARLNVVAHGLTPGQHIAVYGLGGTGYNFSDVEILATPSPDHISYASPGLDEALTADANGRVQQIVPGTAATVEDYTQASSDADSLCALLDGLRLDDICRKCEGPTLLVAAASVDWCLKQIGEVFYREICANPTAVGTMTADGYVSAMGQYQQEGYDSIIRTAPAYQANAKVIMQRILLYYLAAASEQESPSLIGLRIGIGAQVSDPNTDRCEILWNELSTRELKCLGETPYLTTQPSNELSWQFDFRGKALFAELKIIGTGGDSIFSGLLADAKTEAIRRY